MPAAVFDNAPFEIGAKFRVVPPGTAPGSNGRIDLVVTRGAFGSGQHETTASCLELLEEVGDLRGARVLDLGAGTGILGIAALALGARCAVLVDPDPGAARAARRHCELNAVSDRAVVLEGELTDVDSADFDLAFANIQGPILMRVGKELVTKVKVGAPIILSGILWELNWDVRSYFERQGCEQLRNCFLEEYSSVLLRRCA